MALTGCAAPFSLTDEEQSATQSSSIFSQLFFPQDMGYVDILGYLCNVKENDNTPQKGVQKTTY